MKKNLLIGSFLIGIFTLVILGSCDFDKTEDPDAEPDCDNLSDISFADDVLPILVLNCATSGCHDAASASSSYVFEDYAGTKRSVDNSRLIGVINHEAGFSAMPSYSSKMETCDIGKIETWVNEGALDN